MDILNTVWIVIANRDIDIGLVVFFEFAEVNATFLFGYRFPDARDFFSRWPGGLCDVVI